MARKRKTSQKSSQSKKTKKDTAISETQSIDKAAPIETKPTNIELSFPFVNTITILVTDQNKALEYYTNKFGFIKTTDIKYSSAPRYLSVKPNQNSLLQFLLVEAKTESQKAAVGKQAGDGVFAILQVEDCKKVYDEWKNRGVEIVNDLQEKLWGKEFQAKDLYGNVFEVAQYKK